jgi:hypothetical protein
LKAQARDKTIRAKIFNNLPPVLLLVSTSSKFLKKVKKKETVDDVLTPKLEHFFCIFFKNIFKIIKNK